MITFSGFPVEQEEYDDSLRPRKIFGIREAFARELSINVELLVGRTDRGLGRERGVRPQGGPTGFYTGN